MRAFLLMAAFLGLFNRGVSAQTPEARFWKWFVEHEAALLQSTSADTPICDSLAEELHRIDSTITFELGPINAAQREFIISADGIREGFPAVKQLVAAAPALSKWQVRAFRQPDAAPVSLQLGNFTLESEDVTFLAEPDAGKIGVILAIPGYVTTPGHDFERAGYLLLDHFAGEYAVETAIGFIEFVDATSKPPGEWRPLAQLLSALPSTDAP